MELVITYAHSGISCKVMYVEWVQTDNSVQHGIINLQSNGMTVLEIRF